MQVIGISVKKKETRAITETSTKPHEKNPLAGDNKAVELGKKLYVNNCQMCHGANGKGDMGPSLADDVFFGVKGDLADDDYYEVINNGIEPGMVEEGRTAKESMPSFKGTLSRTQIWSLVSYIRSLQGK